MHSRREDLVPGLHRLDGPGAEGRATELAGARPVVRCDTAPEVDELLASPPRSVAAPDLDELRSLAARVRRAEGVVERTRRRAVAEAGARLAGAGAVAVHPETVRSRAADVVRAREALVAAERALAEHAVGGEPDDPVVAVPTVDGSRAGVVAAAELRVRRNQAVGLVMASFGLALVLFALAVVPLWAALLLPFLTSIVALRILGSGGRSARPEPSASASLLDEVDAYTVAEGRADPVEERSTALQELEARRSLAEEDLRVADRSWQDLAGPDADVEDLDAVVRRFDPQHEAAEEVAAGSLSVRAVEAAAARSRLEWEDRWRSLGQPAPTVDERDVAAALARLAERPSPVVVLSGGAVARAEEVVGRLPAAAVLVIGPDPGAG